MKKVLGIILGLTLVLGGVGCTAKQATPQATAELETKKQAAEPTKLVLGIMPSTGALPYVIAKEKGFFEKQGLDVELQLFSSAKDRNAAIQAGELDGMMMDLTGVSILKGNGIPIKATSITQGDFMVIAGATSGITQMSELKSKSVGLSENTLIELVTDLALEKAGMKTTDIVKEEVPATPVRMQLVMENSIAAATLPEPFAVSAIAGGAKELASSIDMGYEFGCFVFTEEMINEHTATIKAFNAAYDEAVDYLATTEREVYLDDIVEYTGYNEETKQYMVVPKYLPTTLPSEKDLKVALDWVKGKGLVSEDLKVSDIVISEMIK